MVKKTAAIAGMTVLLLFMAACGGRTENGHSPAAEPVPVQSEQSATLVSLPKVTDPYTREQASANGDVVNVDGKYTNLEKWRQFMEHVKAKSPEPESVRITLYTIEGDPIFYELVYDGKEIRYTFDNSMDAFGSDQGRPTTTCTGFDTKTVEQAGTFVVLTGCSNGNTGDTFFFDADAK
ncbi:DUF4362 domain-containing protein [Paenibacillus silvisoli]|uniref:DUF4362 domain-containing protein n=1 Tax=Paenibacillus silvisoli TaxID=3110539 RepID=UPI0028057E42|nr:DUF4362 domain-containing protein [Paenibacillus silvisoli]